jgi:Leucine-rich repeat (LRR) protein
MNVKTMIAHSTNLEKLDLSKNSLRDIGIEIISKAFSKSSHTVKEFYVINCDIS